MGGGGGEILEILHSCILKFLARNFPSNHGKSINFNWRKIETSLKSRSFLAKLEIHITEIADFYAICYIDKYFLQEYRKGYIDAAPFRENSHSRPFVRYVSCGLFYNIYLLYSVST